MRQQLKAPISVHLISDHRTGTVKPRRLSWDGQTRDIHQIGLHHTYRRGRTLFHVFGVIANGLYYRLVLDTETLLWTVEEIHDGLPD